MVELCFILRTCTISDFLHLYNSCQAFSNDGQLFSRVVKLLNIQPMLHVDYIATATNLDLLSPHQASLKELAATSAQWDPLMGPASGGIVGGADLVVCNHTWGPLRTDAGLLVANLSSGVRQGGFILLHTLLKGETLGETVSFLTSTSQSSRKQGLLTQVSRGSFQFICIFHPYKHSDSFFKLLKAQRNTFLLSAK